MCPTSKRALIVVSLHINLMSEVNLQLKKGIKYKQIIGFLLATIDKLNKHSRTQTVRIMGFRAIIFIGM